MTDEDVLPDIDPLFVGLTYPPNMLGVPMMFFGVNFMLFGIGLILFSSISGKVFFILFVDIPAHLAAYVMTTQDAHWMAVITTMFERCGPTRNKPFWKSNSFMP